METSQIQSSVLSGWVIYIILRFIFSQSANEVQTQIYNNLDGFRELWFIFKYILYNSQIRFKYDREPKNGCVIG